MNAPDILVLIERLERDLAALKRAVQPDDDDAIVRLARENVAKARAKGGAK